MRRVNNFGLLEISSNVLRIKEVAEGNLGYPLLCALAMLILYLAQANTDVVLEIIKYFYNNDQTYTFL